MTTTRVILGTVAAFMALIVLTAWGSTLAALYGADRQAEALHHMSWMFLLAGGMCGVAGLVMALVMALADEVRASRASQPYVAAVRVGAMSVNEVRTARVLGTVISQALHGSNPVGSGAGRSIQREM